MNIDQMPEKEWPSTKKQMEKLREVIERLNETSGAITLLVQSHADIISNTHAIKTLISMIGELKQDVKILKATNHEATEADAPSSETKPNE